MSGTASDLAQARGPMRRLAQRETEPAWGVGDRRRFLQASASAFGAAVLSPVLETASARDKETTTIIELPRLRVPASFIIDDSTCLVNMGHFCMPQFAEAWPERAAYKKPWKTWPREIPDRFVRQFGEWCAEQGVKGKYSVVPYPACVGWLDRFLPGWSKADLRNSLRLVRELMVPNWDIHPEMITHTRVIDLKTGRPLPKANASTMENSYPQEKKSVDELAAYLAYALRILKNCDLPCEGITTPGGFGNRVKPELSLAVHEAVRDVFGSELPHYFKYVAGSNESTQPRIENLGDSHDNARQATVSVWAGTGDWFGGWDGDLVPQPEKYCSADATSGRMVELIERREPAVMLCHWPGLYSHGTLRGFRAFQRVITSLHSRFADQLLWMKTSELARYYAVKQLAKLKDSPTGITIESPFGTGLFTLRTIKRRGSALRVERGDQSYLLRPVASPSALEEGCYWESDSEWVICFALNKGVTAVRW